MRFYKKGILVITVLAIVSVINPCRGDVVILKGGEIVEGVIVDVRDDSIKVKVDNGIQVIARSDIETTQPTLAQLKNLKMAAPQDGQLSFSKYDTPDKYFMKFVAEIAFIPGVNFLADENRKEVLKPPFWKGGIKFGGRPIPYLGIEFAPFGYYNETSEHQVYGGGFDASVKGIIPTGTIVNPYLGGGISWAKVRSEERGYYQNNGDFVETSNENFKIDWSGLGGHILFGADFYASPIISFLLQGKYSFLPMELSKLKWRTYEWGLDEVNDYTSYPTELELGGFDLAIGINFHFGARP
ncbi:hypothetical protein JW877_08855 [bacterium]|nr:hypothetical protein [bacterium]